MDLHKKQNDFRSPGTSRRAFLGTAAKAALAAAPLGALARYAPAAVKPEETREYDLLIPRVRYEREFGPDQWNMHPQGEQNLLREFSRVVNCRVKLHPAYRRFGKAEEFNAIVDFDTFPDSGMYPFVFMTGQTPFVFSTREKDNLVRYLDRGGFLLMDDCVYQHDKDLFYQRGCEVLAELFPGRFVELAPDHEIFRNVFEIPELPYVQGVKRPPMGVVLNGRLSVFLSSTDLHCGWIGRFFDKKTAFEDSIKMGINVLYYAMTT